MALRDSLFEHLQDHERTIAAFIEAQVRPAGHRPLYYYLQALRQLYSPEEIWHGDLCHRVDELIADTARALPRTRG